MSELFRGKQSDRSSAWTKVVGGKGISRDKIHLKTRPDFLPGTGRSPLVLIKPVFSSGYCSKCGAGLRELELSRRIGLS